MCIEYGVEVSPEELKNVEVINIIYFLNFLMLWEFILSFIVCDSIFQVFKALKGHWRFFDFVKEGIKGILKDLVEFSFLTSNPKRGFTDLSEGEAGFPNVEPCFLDWGPSFPRGDSVSRKGDPIFLRGPLSLRDCFFPTNERDIVSLKID